MKRFVLSLVFCLVAGVAAQAGEKISVGVTPFPHKDIMEVVKQLLAKDGYELEIREFTDYVQPNMALSEKQLFANFFQHIPYLEDMNEKGNLGLAWIAKVHIEPLGLYSNKIKGLNELKAGSTVAVPNDPTNEARALRLLEDNGLIKLKEGALVTVLDITDNPRNLKFSELEASMLPRTLDDVTASVINTNFAGEAGLNPSVDAIIIEGKDSPYANVVVIRAADIGTPAAVALQKASNSPEVKEYIVKNLIPKGIVPAF